MNGLISMQESCDLPSKLLQSHSISQREILLEKKTKLEYDLKKIEQALEFFDKNPTFEQGLDVLSKALRC